MKRKEILVLIGELLGSRAVYSVASLVITITMLSGITIILRNDIRDIKNYVQSVVDGDPNYREIHSQVSGSENVIRGNIDVEALLTKDDKETETTSTANNISGGYDDYTPTQTVTDDYNNKPSNGLNNSNSGGTTVANNNNSSNNNSTNEVNNRNNTSDEEKKEEVLDRSSFNGKDIMISEGEPFNPMNGLQLAATDINGKNITNKIVIKENNVDTYKPGLYTVKATVELSDKSNLEKEFFVRVEPTVLNLAINDVRTSKDVLEKSEEFNLSFSVKSSKSYLEVASVNINDKDYDVKKTSSSSFFRKSNKYEVDLVAPTKGGTEKIEIKSVTMSDGTIVDINKSINVEVLKEEAHIIDAVVKNITSEDEDMFLEYNLEDVDNVLNEAFLYLYDENDVLIQQEELEKNNKSSINLNINENGKYKVQIKGYYRENLDTVNELYKEKELFTENLEVNKFNNDNTLENYELSLMSMEYDENYNNYNEINAETFVEGRSINSTIQLVEEEIHQVQITGSIADYKGDFPPSTIQVVVPTAAKFTVTKDGVLVGTNITIKNEGSETISVIAEKFIDKTSVSGINVVDESELVGNDRKKVSLTLAGDLASVDLRTETSNKLGLFKTGGTEVAVGEDVVLDNIKGGSWKTLELRGKAVKTGIPLDEAINDSFTLILKIKKSEKN